MSRRRAPARVFVAVASVVILVPPSPALAAPRERHRHSRPPAPAQAPSGPPLAGPGARGEKAEQTVGIQSAAGDQLAENGLASPLCKGAVAGALSSAARADCASSGFVAAAAPSNNYALDVHIDTGAFGLSKGTLLSVVQDMAIAPAWGALQWLVQALVAMLEWCYAVELIGGSGDSTVAHALLRARAGFTDPWLALVLALASMLALYHGIVRRRVADTLGGVTAMLAMMAGGLWVIADPGGTVGTVGGWADRASLGTLAATASGSPADAAATLGDSMRALYAGSIETPWCYLEFGNVRWCDDPSQLDPRLRAAALALVAGGEGSRSAPPPHSAQLVRAATTNGALFLAFPANGPQRNSINDEASLLRAICQSEEATECKGAAASEAEFRTDGGTFPRLLGLLAIAAGVLGMALLFGLIALRLLAAAFVGLFLLLLAPFAVLAPAFGDGGRAVFVAWLTRLLGAVTAKLSFSFVLGALLTMQRELLGLDGLGWWTQWLLVSAFWWLIFLKRHEIAVVLREGGAPRARPQRDSRSHSPTAAAAGSGGRPPGGGRPRALVRRVESSLQTYGAIRHPARWAEAQIEARIAPRRPHEEKPPKRGRNAGGVTFTALRQRLRGGGANGPRRDRGRRAGVKADLFAAAGGRAGSGRARAPEPSPAVQPPLAPRVAERDRTKRGAPVSQPAVRASDRAGEALTGGTGKAAPAAPVPRGAAAAPAAPRRPPREARSPVMEDAFAVQQRRKRQLGFDRP